MRYTTIIDISELRQLYRSPSVRLVYLHAVLRAGYTDADRDKCALSIRNTAADTGLSISAVRCALARLQAAGLLVKTEGGYLVKKWLPAPTYSSRPSSPGKKGDVTANVYTKDDKPSSEDEWRQNRADTLRMALEKVKKNPRSMMRAMLDDAYHTGELQLYGIKYEPNK